jgi:hypothetical protein
MYIHDKTLPNSSQTDKHLKTAVVEKTNTFTFNTFFFRKSCRFRDNAEKYGKAEDTVLRRMRNACLITKATDTHSEPVILIAFPLQ